jgi:hypothetical protein
MQRLAGPLGLGRQKEAYFELSMSWADHFRRLASSSGVTGDLTLITLADWIDKPEPRGLDDFLVKLIVASFAEMDDRVWVRGGMPLDPAPELSQIKDHDALRSQPLPSEDAWQRARERFEALFGQKAPTLLRGRMVNQFARQITEQARAHQEAAADLVRRLEEHAHFLGLDETEETGRLAIARRSLDLLKALVGSGGSAGSAGWGASAAKKTVETLAAFDFGPVSPDRFGTSIKQALAVAQALTAASWATLELAAGQGPDGLALLESLRNVARGDQRTGDLGQALRRATEDVLALMKRQQAAGAPAHAPAAPAQRGPAEVDLTTPSSVPPVSASPGPKPAPNGGRAARAARRAGGGRTTAARAAAELSAELAELAVLEPNATVEITWRVVEG